MENTCRNHQSSRPISWHLFIRRPCRSCWTSPGSGTVSPLREESRAVGNCAATSALEGIHSETQLQNYSKIQYTKMIKHVNQGVLTNPARNQRCWKLGVSSSWRSQQLKVSELLREDSFASSFGLARRSGWWSGEMFLAVVLCLSQLQELFCEGRTSTSVKSLASVTLARKKPPV